MIILADIQQQYIGCYRDGGSGNRVMTGVQRVNQAMTVDACQSFCHRSYYTYFGLAVYNPAL